MLIKAIDKIKEGVFENTPSFIVKRVILPEIWRDGTF